MKNNITLNLLIVNLIGTLAIAGYLLYKSGAEKDPLTQEQIIVTLDAEQLPAQVIKLDPQVTNSSQSLDKLTSTIQRFNTSLIQYDYLKEEMKKLSTLDRAIGLRAQATTNAKTDKNKKEVEEALAKLTNVAKQVRGQQSVRHQTMLKLISGLEKQLAQVNVPIQSSQPARRLPQPVQNTKPAKTSKPATPAAKTPNPKKVTPKKKTSSSPK